MRGKQWQAGKAALSFFDHDVLAVPSLHFLPPFLRSIFCLYLLPHLAVHVASVPDGWP